MPLPKVHRNVTDQNGNIVPGVLCSVYNQGTAVLAPLYQDDAGTVPLSNPLTNDATYGSVKFYINPGHFDLSFTKPGYTFESIMDFQVPQDVLTLGSMSTQNANAVAITGGSATGLSALAVAGGNLAVINGAVGLSTAPVPGVALAVGAAPSVFAGQIAVGGATATSACYIHVLHQKASHHGVVIRPVDADAGGAAEIMFQAFAGTPVGSIMSTATATAYNTTSDGRLKEAIEALPQALDTIKRLLPVQFRWKSTGEMGQGFIAQDVQPLVPQAVTGSPDDPAPTMQMDHSKLIPHLVGAVQELAAQVQGLTARLVVLEGVA